MNFGSYDTHTIDFFIGSPGSGKTTAISYTIAMKFQNGCFDSLVLCCAGDVDKDYPYIPEKLRAKRPYETAVERFIQHQEKKNKTGEAKKWLWIFDDCVGAINWNESALQRFIANHRKWNSDIIIATQYIFKIPPLIREAATRANIFEQQTKKSIEAIFDSYGQTFENYKAFKEYLMKTTNRKNHVFVHYTKSPQEGQSMFQPMKVPLLSFTITLTKAGEQEDGEEDAEVEQGEMISPQPVPKRMKRE
jgi:hypothetical protein